MMLDMQESLSEMGYGNMWGAQMEKRNFLQQHKNIKQLQIEREFSVARTGLKKKSTRVYVTGSAKQSTLTAEIVRAIREREAAGEKMSVIARSLELSRSTVTRIVQRKRWADV